MLHVNRFEPNQLQPDSNQYIVYCFPSLAHHQTGLQPSSVLDNPVPTQLKPPIWPETGSNRPKATDCIGCLNIFNQNQSKTQTDFSSNQFWQKLAKPNRFTIWSDRLKKTKKIYYNLHLSMHYYLPLQFNLKMMITK